MLALRSEMGGFVLMSSKAGCFVFGLELALREG